MSSPSRAAADSGFATPERNRFYYGKLMDVVHFSKEQDYFKLNRWLLNRLVVGGGVTAGLSVTVDQQGILTIQPGMAIDGFGREIIVPAAVTVDPLKLIDEQGKTAEADPQKITTISLAYIEREADPAPVLVADCDAPGSCACGTIREEYQVLVRQDIPARLAPAPLPVDGPQAQVSGVSLGVPQDPSVPLASLDTNGLTAAPPLVYSNALLFELILSLADRIKKLGG
jgi:hypothetical protein